MTPAEAQEETVMNHWWISGDRKHAEGQGSAWEGGLYLLNSRLMSPDLKKAAFTF